MNTIHFSKIFREGVRPLDPLSLTLSLTLTLTLFLACRSQEASDLHSTPLVPRSVPFRCGCFLPPCFPVLARLLTWGEGEPESEVVVPVAGRVVAPARRPAIPGGVVPAPAPNDTVRACGWTGRVGG